MYEKEETKLNDFRERLEQVPLPIEKADAAIMQGLERAKRDKMQTRAKRKRTFWSLAVAALLMLTVVTTIRVSPTFANAVASIPGMETFVELIQDDKGLTAIFENDYYQPIGESQTIGHTTMTIDGVVLDESGMDIFYTIESPAEMDDIIINTPVLKNQQQELDSASISYSSPVPEEESPKIYTDILKYTFEDSMNFEDLSFTLELETILNGDLFDFSIPFVVPENVKPSVVYDMNKEVEVEGQKFTIEDVTIHPLRVGIKISFDPANTKKILQFEDMRLEDDNGEIWSSISNGISATGDIEDGEMLYYIQSNYFEKPKQLYLRINKIQAVDKEDAYFLVDTDQNLLVHSPKDGKLALTKSSRTGFEMTLKLDSENEHTYGIDRNITDTTGAPIEMRYSGISSGYEDRQIIDIGIEDTGYLNPVKVELFSYPNYINSNLKIELPKK
ncbi:DUF4179 domain-containing protein [Planococcus versutus]|uniref:DUF4179 domain-containing protein n=1 Tax=Planococcus versutus TaxID=1302659 RepID=A0A1B1RZ46_9BACL|nr:DUF4179 domain-containing protein [Planococcus versutus]ANU26238.1 hypothetical protein I858_004230 [Planococcus versutus]